MDYTPVFRSPIAVEAYSNQKTNVENLKLVDLTGVPIVLVQGDAGQMLQKQLGSSPANPGDIVDVTGGVLARLTRKEFYLFGLSTEVNLPAAADLSDSQVRATDFTHGRAALKLSGFAAAEVLSKICGLDFRDRAFPNMQAKQSSAAKITTLIARRDEGSTPVYHLHVDRPLGRYFWEIVWDAGQEFGIGVAQ